MNENTRGLFTITQAANACGLSRSTLMRMEERGLLIPVYTDQKSGRRYYDNHNISRILQIRRFQSMGFDAEETAAYFTGGGNAKGLLNTLEDKLDFMQRNVEELRIRAMEVPDLSIQLLRLPEMVCCVRRYNGMSYQEKYNAMYDFYHECVENGYVLAPEPLFIINENTEYLEGQFPDHSYPFQVCVPVIPGSAPSDAVCFPSCTALSILFYGFDYNKRKEASLRLGMEVKERGLTPDGFPRGISIVGPYVGREIEQDCYCSRYAVPVKV